jgi:hypothetical protein
MDLGPSQVHPINVLAKFMSHKVFKMKIEKKTLIIKMVIEIQASHFYGLDLFFSRSNFGWHMD